jgi:hypothetical protein
MRRPRISIRMLMAVVLIVAADAAALRSLAAEFRTNDSVMYPNARPTPLMFFIEFFPHQRVCALGLLPMANVLVFGLLSLFRNVRSGGRAHTFLVGFEVSGAVVFFLVGGYLLSNSYTLLSIYGKTLLRHLPFEDQIRNMSPDAIGFWIWSTLCTLPQLLLAVTGGWIATKKLRVALVILPRDKPPVASEKA